MSGLRAVLAGGTLALAAGLPGVALGQQDEQRLAFRVLLDDKPIGRHEFRIRDGQGRRVVETEARFDVKMLFVTVFSYRHDNTEVWRDGCLQSLESETDSNGTPYRVSLESGDDGYRVVTRDGREFYPADCLMSFAYWDRRFLERERLVNSQTGELLEVDIRPLGRQELEWAELSGPVEGFRIVSEAGADTEAEDVDIKVYYRESDQRWVALESTLESGRLMRYLPAGADATARAAGTVER